MPISTHPFQERKGQKGKVERARKRKG